MAAMFTAKFSGMMGLGFQHVVDAVRAFVTFRALPTGSSGEWRRRRASSVADPMFQRVMVSCSMALKITGAACGSCD